MCRTRRLPPTPPTLSALSVYASCASCHGAAGGGGSGPAFAGGNLLKVFPKWEDQVKWVNIGSSNWTAQTGSKTFGDTKNPIGAGGMPGFGPLGSDKSLTCEDIVMVVRYERQHFAGEARRRQARHAGRADRLGRPGHGHPELRRVLTIAATRG